MARVAIHRMCDVIKTKKSSRNQPTETSKKKHSDKDQGVLMKKKECKKRWKQRRTEKQNIKMEEIQERFKKSDITALQNL